jgi:hypothetical protein
VVFGLHQDDACLVAGEERGQMRNETGKQVERAVVRSATLVNYKRNEAKTPRRGVLK